MQAPFICSFQTAFYIITIEDLSHSNSLFGVPAAVSRQANYTSSSRMINETFSSELRANKNYTLTITIVEEMFEAVVSQKKNFSNLKVTVVHFD